VGIQFARVVEIGARRRQKNREKSRGESESITETEDRWEMRRATPGIVLPTQGERKSKNAKKKTARRQTRQTRTVNVAQSIEKKQRTDSATHRKKNRKQIGRQRNTESNAIDAPR
jgi:hypothetical protein